MIKERLSFRYGEEKVCRKHRKNKTVFIGRMGEEDKSKTALINFL